MEGLQRSSVGVRVGTGDGCAVIHKKRSTGMPCETIGWRSVVRSSAVTLAWETLSAQPSVLKEH